MIKKYNRNNPAMGLLIARSLLILLSALCTQAAFAQSATPDTLLPGPVAVYMPVASKEHPVVEQHPEFAGSVAEYVSKSIQYPRIAVKRRTQGTVWVRFTIVEDGSVTDAHVIKPVSPGLDAEALRVVRAMPVWKPGKINGRPVKYYYNLPVRFILQN